jgi:hypothetical protein
VSIGLGRSAEVVGGGVVPPTLTFWVVRPAEDEVRDAHAVLYPLRATEIVSPQADAVDQPFEVERALHDSAKVGAGVFSESDMWEWRR